MKKFRPGRLLGWLVFAVIIVFCVKLVLDRKKDQHELLLKINREDERPFVNYVIPKVATDTVQITLPGSLQPYLSTQLYGRVNGYIGKWFADLGKQVQAGEILATIETPELDQQLAQLRTAELLAKSNLERVESVSLPGAVSVQELDTRKSAYASSVAARKQLEAQRAFNTIKAPFTGIVSARNVDFGTLVNANGTGLPLFKIDQVNKLRINVEVPQVYAFFMKPGLKADLKFKEFPGKKFQASLFLTSGVINPDSRTLNTVFLVDNSENKLLSGMYTEVNIEVLRRDSPIVLPASALYIQNDKPHVIRIDSQNRVHIVPVILGQDNGITVEILKGITPEQKLVNFPTDILAEEMEVRLVAPAKETENPAPGSAQTANPKPENPKGGGKKSE